MEKKKMEKKRWKKKMKKKDEKKNRKGIISIIPSQQPENNGKQR